MGRLGCADPRRLTLADQSPSLGEVALRGLCPECGAATLFAGPVRFADRCRACGLDFSAFNVGDGPAAFLTLGIGALVSILAIAVELAWSPPIWLHVLLWLPITLALVIGSLRVAKAALAASEWRHKAGEGRR